MIVVTRFSQWFETGVPILMRRDAALAGTVPSALKKRAFLIYDLNSSSHTFHRVALALTAKGYRDLVIAPNLLGHALRKPEVDLQIQTLADDLLPYLQAAECDIVIDRALAELVVLSLLKYLPKTKPTAVVLIDPALEVNAKQMVYWKAKGNVPWSFSHLFADKPGAAALTVLIEDLQFNGDLKLKTLAKIEQWLFRIPRTGYSVNSWK
ncbi:hypothetical protein F4604DRAFT_1672697 [Suillus subluteus]|nr:hypothetical protein F4604DRAFT_1672697 [Suillus subluteus]